MRLDDRWMLCAALAVALAAPAPGARAQEQPLMAGADGVAVPKRRKFVQPVYPPEAAARGLRGIVILELVIGPDGRIDAVEVIRSVPPFDDAARAAAREWEYEPTIVDGRRVSVRLTVPISFLMKLPDITRQEGIPELRSGAVPPFPPETDRTEIVTAFVTLAGDGQVAEATVLEGRSPWTESLIRALLTWRFDARELETGISVSFRVEARYKPEGRGVAENQVELDLAGLQTSETMVAAAGAGAAEPSPGPAEPEAAGGEESADPVERGGEGATPGDVRTGGVAATAEDGVASPSSPETEHAATSPAAGEAAGSEHDAEPEAVDISAAEPETETPAAEAAPGEPEVETPEPEATETADAADDGAPADPESADAAEIAEPETEVLTADAALPPEPEPVPEPGISSVRGVFLEAGVPDLSRGRRPMMPPFARIGREEGEVEVRFAVDAAGETFVNSVEGPETFRLAARTTVESWFFPRETAERLYMLARFSYQDDQVSATVRLER